MQRSYQKTRELCGERQVCLLFKRESVFKTTLQSCEGLGLNYNEYSEFRGIPLSKQGCNEL